MTCCKNQSFNTTIKIVWPFKVIILTFFMKSNPVFDNIYGQHFFRDRQCIYILLLPHYIEVFIVSDVIPALDSNCFHRNEGFTGNEACR